MQQPKVELGRLLVWVAAMTIRRGGDAFPMPPDGPIRHKRQPYGQKSPSALPLGQFVRFPGCAKHAGQFGVALTANWSGLLGAMGMCLGVEPRGGEYGLHGV
jgi:hypothetical protein